MSKSNFDLLLLIVVLFHNKFSCVKNTLNLIKRLFFDCGTPQVVFFFKVQFAVCRCFFSSGLRIPLQYSGSCHF